MTSSNKKDNVYKLIDGAKAAAVDDSTTGGGGGSGGGSTFVEFGAESEKFIEKDGKLYKIRRVKDEDRMILLANFTGYISEVIYYDEGAGDDPEQFLKLTLVTNIGQAKSKKMSADDFYSRDVINKNFGPEYILFAKHQAYKNLINYLRIKSTALDLMASTTVYASTGFRFIDGYWQYLTNAGAICSEGLISANVDLKRQNLASYSLPAPDLDRLKLDFANFFPKILAISPTVPALGYFMLCVMPRALLEEISPAEFSIFFYGTTGSMKTTIAKFLMSFFGSGFIDAGPTTSFSDTVNLIEQVFFTVKDAPVLTDDARSVSVKQSDAMHDALDRILRNKANKSSRGRFSETTHKPARSLPIVTAEEPPRNASAIARTLTVNFPKDTFDKKNLSELQRLARRGDFANLTACFIAWLCSRLDALRPEFRNNCEALRDGFIQSGKLPGAHERAPGMIAELIASSEIFTEFLSDCGILPAVESNSFLADTETALLSIFGEQSAHVDDADECIRFIRLLASGLKAGLCNIENPLDHGPPKTTTPFIFGWRDPIHAENGEKIYRRCGELIGWYYPGTEDAPDEIWLEPNLAYSAAQFLASRQKQQIAVPASTIWRQMLDRGYIAKPYKHGHEVRPRASRTISNQKTPVIVIEARLLKSGPDDFNNIKKNETE
ncbi:MAG: hypothetical protein CVV06_01400 [Gammaproteobacteria bacterium HGW-Gammaproteobacteria-10]|nr:MAG: hypothetical protein CVV06_01400 [Gammaproteobacteria bacterium HGW-Gammaproteobacteria-10]